MTEQEFFAILQFAEYLELTEKDSKLYKKVIEHLRKIVRNYCKRL